MRVVLQELVAELRARPASPAQAPAPAPAPAPAATGTAPTPPKMGEIIEEDGRKTIKMGGVPAVDWSKLDSTTKWTHPGQYRSLDRTKGIKLFQSLKPLDPVWNKGDKMSALQEHIYKEACNYGFEQNCYVKHPHKADQGLFVRRELFEDMGGFPDIPLMEDVAICRRLKRQTPPVRQGYYVTTSSRRWENRGILKTVVEMWRMRLAYYFGASPQYLASCYYANDSDCPH